MSKLTSRVLAKSDGNKKTRILGCIVSSKISIILGSRYIVDLFITTGTGVSFSYQLLKVGRRLVIPFPTACSTPGFSISCFLGLINREWSDTMVSPP